MRITNFMVVVGLSALMATQCAQATTDIAGVKLDDEVTLGNQKLVLNGAGIRYKFIIQVYVAGLYIPKKANNLPDVLAEPGPKRVSVTMLREISADDLGDALLTGIRKNLTRDETQRIGLQLVKLGELFGTIPRLKKGDTFSLDYVPPQGTTIYVNGKAVTDPLPDEAFIDAILKIWMGNNPADSGLKPAMLGIKHDAPVTNSSSNSIRN